MSTERTTDLQAKFAPPATRARARQQWQPVADDGDDWDIDAEKALAAVDEIEAQQPELANKTFYRRLRYLLEHGWQEEG